VGISGRRLKKYLIRGEVVEYRRRGPINDVTGCQNGVTPKL
jgi:hypothetical protein